MTSPDSSLAFSEFELQRSVRVRRSIRQRSLLAILLFALLLVSFKIGEVNAVVFYDGMGQLGDYFVRMAPEIHLGTFFDDLRSWYWGMSIWSKAAFDTIVIAFLSTTVGTIVAVPLSFIAASNLSNPLTYNIVRRSLELIRTVPVLVYALVFVLAFGLGPLAGVLAMALHTASSLGKLFSEVNEGIDRRQVESTVAAGGNWFAVVRLSVWPQVVPTFVSYILLRLEKNIRGATVIGFVGAGGIGQELFLAIRSFQYTDVSAITLMIILIVVVSDMTCDFLRQRIL